MAAPTPQLQLIEEHASTVEFQRGIEALSERRVCEAVRHFRYAENLGHDRDESAAQRWYCWMLLGAFDLAWRESDSIAQRGAPDPNRLWDGLPLENKRVIIRCLHGFGDAIQFLRYAPLVRRRASWLVVETHPEMVALLSGLAFVDEVVTWDDEYVNWDSQIEVMELPYIFRTAIDTIPASPAYLQVSQEEKAQSAAKLPSHGLRRVGVVWDSSRWNPARSIPFSEFSRIFRVPGITFCSFQRGAARADLAGINPRACHDTADFSQEIEETAADLANMDLLITVDTMAAHLAGALGVPVWNLLHHSADWRWMWEGSETPWYPHMRLIRQPAPGAWGAVVDQVIHDLRRFVFGMTTSKKN